MWFSVKLSNFFYAIIILNLSTIFTTFAPNLIKHISCLQFLIYRYNLVKEFYSTK